MWWPVCGAPLKGADVNGYNQPAQLVSLNVPGNGTPRTSTYAVSPAAGVAWLPSDNGAYTIWMQTNQVADTEGAFVAAGLLGQFQVNVPVAVYAAGMDTDPGWTFEPQKVDDVGLPLRS